ncbi:hypothetical protein P3589_22840 [Vibrio parahaemolyticus]|nr:hypothetical protein [Vibrio parahaemolyticus]
MFKVVCGGFGIVLLPP